MSQHRYHNQLVAALWATACVVLLLGVNTVLVRAADPYWYSLPFHLLYRDILVAKAPTALWPYAGSSDLWETAAESAADDLDSTNLTVGYGSLPSASAGYVNVDWSTKVTFDFTMATTAHYGLRIVNGIPEVIDCRKNYPLQNAPKCTAEENKVLKATIIVNAGHPYWQEGNAVTPAGVRLSDYSIRRRVLTHELVHVPGHGHAECAMVTVMKMVGDKGLCSGQREMTAHDKSWVNTRYP